MDKTDRGFNIDEFQDRYDIPCSLQESSLATEDCIWLGANGNRMHLTKDHVKKLLPYLQTFVETGRLE